MDVGPETRIWPIQGLSSGSPVSYIPAVFSTPTVTFTYTAWVDSDVQTVFHNSDPAENEHVLANVENLLADDSVEMDDVAVLLNGDAAPLLTVEGDDELAEPVADLQDDGVDFFVCQNSLHARDLDASDVRERVRVVPSGVGLLTKLQDEGYAYITP